MRKFFSFIVITALVCLASSCNKDTPDSPEAGPGKFSVADGKKVYFTTKGDVLMMCPEGGDPADNTSDMWRIAYNHYDTSPLPEGAGYNGTGCILYGTSTWTNIVPKADWALKVDDSSLRVLSIDEWHYLVSYGDKKNSTREGLVAYGVTVAGVRNCVIIYPDGYKGKIVTDGDTTTYNDVSDWKVAEKEYVVCLPPSSMHIFGCYWSSSTNGSKTYVFAWSSSNLYGQKITQINTSGRACVRLVRDVK